MLIIFQDYICFLSEMFMNQTKKVFPINRIEKIQKLQDGILLKNFDQEELIFSLGEASKLVEAHQIMEQIWMMTPKLSAAELEEQEHVEDVVDAPNAPEPEEEDAEGHDSSSRQILTEKDWDLILNGAKRVKYNDKDVIIRAGENYQKIYHIVRGTCSVVVEREGELVPVNTMTSGTTFGEMSFINISEDKEYTASATVVAKGEVELSVIQGYFINILFSMHEGFEKRFFEYLCNVLAQRINKQTLKFGKK